MDGGLRSSSSSLAKFADALILAKLGQMDETRAAVRGALLLDPTYTVAAIAKARRTIIRPI